MYIRVFACKLADQQALGSHALLKKVDVPLGMKIDRVERGKLCNLPIIVHRSSPSMC